MITTSYLIGDLAADRIRALHAEARRLARPDPAVQRTAPVRWWRWTRLRASDSQSPHAPDLRTKDSRG
ncbi:hypothetical protein [Pseudonocardia lacus]|uniref:hypothetical protein n=1 Tax=Pseudonocardia lacus TaxID=2835865 RepID=UPI001BDC39B8|nr:hypothetical protein [Pseudonocardia lacus]